MKITIYRNRATNSLEFRAIKYEHNKTFAMVDGECIEIGIAQEIPCILRMPYHTEIETDISESNFKELLKQKHEDKEDHIQNLNEILLRIVDK